MSKTIKDALTALFKSKGGDVTALADNKDISDVIDDLAGVIVSKDDLNPKVIPWAVAGSKTLFNTAVSDMQDDINVVGNAIIGELKYISSGDLVTTWGAGNFIALKFISLDPAVTYENVKVGLNPSQSSGLVNLDADMDGVFKVTDKDAQTFVIVVTVDGVETVTEYNLSGLVCDNN